MQVTLKLYAMLADHLPPGSRNNRIELTVQPASTVAELIAQADLPPRLVHLVLLNGVFVPPEARATTCLSPGDTLAIWPPIAGG